MSLSNVRCAFRGMKLTTGSVTLAKGDDNLIGISIGGGAPYCPCLYVVQVSQNNLSEKIFGFLKVVVFFFRYLMQAPLLKKALSRQAMKSSASVLIASKEKPSVKWRSSFKAKRWVVVRLVSSEKIILLSEIVPVRSNEFFLKHRTKFWSNTTSFTPTRNKGKLWILVSSFWIVFWI